MRKAILFFCTFFVKIPLFAADICVDNETCCRCYIFADKPDFVFLVNYQKWRRCVELPPGKSVTITLPTCDEATNFPKELYCLLESGWIFKKNECVFPIQLLLEKWNNALLPVLNGPNRGVVTRLTGRNGFCMQKYVNGRRDTYIFKIWQKPRDQVIEPELPASSISEAPLLSAHTQK